MDKTLGTISAIIAGVIGLAIVAILVSQRSQTASVIGSSGSALANVISAAVSPVSGASAAINTGASSDPLSGLLRGSGGLDLTSALGLAAGIPSSFLGAGGFGGGFL